MTEARERKKAGEKKKKKRLHLHLVNQKLRCFFSGLAYKSNHICQLLSFFFFLLVRVALKKNRICSYNNASKRSLLIVFFFLSFLSALHCFTFRHADRKLMSGDLAWWSRPSGQKSLTSEKKKKLLLIFNRV